MQVQKNALALQSGKRLGIAISAREEMFVYHMDFATFRGKIGQVDRVYSSIMGETCDVTWQDGTRGRYAMALAPILYDNFSQIFTIPLEQICLWRFG